MGARQSVKSGHSLRTDPESISALEGCQGGVRARRLGIVSPRATVYRGSLN